MTELSVVLISKDQEWNIARLVESVLAETGALPEREIVLVDSASMDRTTEIAAHYPISVLKLSPEQRLSAAAGRYVGYQWTAGELVLFLDGDMALCQGWLDEALRVMKNKPEVAAVCGKVIDRPKEYQGQDEETPTARIGQLESASVEYGGVDVLQGGGAAMYRRSVMEQVGSFNPYLYADEEPELCLRIRQAGYRVFQLNRPIAFHYTVTFHALSNFLGKRRHRFFYGYGQNMRRFFGTPLFLPYLKERGWAIPPALFLGAGVVTMIASILTGQWIWLTAWVVLLGLLTMGIALRKRSLKGALLTLFLRLLILEGSVRGFLLPPKDPTGYPGNYIIIKKAYN